MNDEWSYLLNTRNTQSGIRYAKAQVNGVNGLILLPDDWSSSYYNLNSTNTNKANYSTNIITDSQWDILEQHGAVFLPAAGMRYGTNISARGPQGYYWSTSYWGSNSSYHMNFSNSHISLGSTNRSDGNSVRLVHDAE